MAERKQPGAWAAIGFFGMLVAVGTVLFIDILADGQRCRSPAADGQPACVEWLLEDRADGDAQVVMATQMVYTGGVADGPRPWQTAAVDADGDQYLIDFETMGDDSGFYPSYDFHPRDTWLAAFQPIPLEVWEEAPGIRALVQDVLPDDVQVYSMTLTWPHGTAEPTWVVRAGAPVLVGRGDGTHGRVAEAVLRVSPGGEVLRKGPEALGQQTALEAVDAAEQAAPLGMMVRSARAVEAERGLVHENDLYSIPLLPDRDFVDGRASAWIVTFGRAEPNGNVVVAVVGGTARIIQEGLPGSPLLPGRAALIDSDQSAERVRLACEWSPADMQYEPGSGARGARYWFDDHRVDGDTGLIECGRQ